MAGLHVPLSTLRHSPRGPSTHDLGPSWIATPSMSGVLIPFLMPVYPGAFIAVGTALAGGPPHRSQRALLTHWAPASGQTCSRASGKGCTTRAGGSHRVARRFIRTQPIRV